MRNSILMFLLLATLGTATGRAGVSVEYSSQADFSQYASFSWVEGSAAQDPQFEQWLQNAVTRELLAKGLKKLDEGGDLLVRTRVSVEKKQRAEVDIIGDRGIWGEDVTHATRTGETMREVGLGIAVVELLDGYSKLQVWQGVVGAEARPEVGNQSEKRINKLIGKMFRKYPPK